MDQLTDWIRSDISKEDQILYGYSYFNNIIIQEVSACGLRPHFHLDMLSVIRAFRFRKWFQIPKRCHTGVDRKWHKKIKKEHQRMHRRRDKGSTSAQNLEEANYKGDKSCTRALLRAHWSPMGSNSIETQTVLDPSKSGPDPIPCKRDLCYLSCEISDLCCNSNQCIIFLLVVKYIDLFPIRLEAESIRLQCWTSSDCKNNISRSVQENSDRGLVT